MNRRTLISIGFALPLVIGIAALALAIAATGAHRGAARLSGSADGPDPGRHDQQHRLAAAAPFLGDDRQRRLTGRWSSSATRTDAASGFDVSQTRLRRRRRLDAAARRGASLVWGGDGHSHWHVRDLENYELDRLDNGSKVGTGDEERLLLLRHDRLQARRSPARRPPQVYTPGTSAAQNDQAATSLRMGISVGWGDRYGINSPRPVHRRHRT